MRRLVVLACAAAAVLLAGCERPPVETVQRGFRGLGMEQVYNPRTLVADAKNHVVPEAQPTVPSEGPKAKDVYQNVKVLGDLSAGEFTRLMVAMTQWVSPEASCTYCHNGANFADDSLYTKVVARRMIEMTRHINADWKGHVAETGVTCYTCHRGKPVPKQVWFAAPPQKTAAYVGNRQGQNVAAPVANLSSLPEDPLSAYLSGANEIRVAATTALPQGTGSTIKNTEWTYSLMMHMSQSLGVNCTYCHNTRQFGDWSQSTPQRNTAWYGIRMARDLNNAYLTPLTSTFPANRLGPTGDVAKINCGTCHQGAYKPLYGDGSLYKAHPELGAKAAVVGGVPASEGTAQGAVLYFAVGSAALAGDAAKAMEQLVASLKAAPDAKAVISGFHSAAGDAAANAELAKQRAMAVRDALKAAGIAEDRVVLEKPQETQANAAGEDPKSRRVEIAMK